MWVEARVCSVLVRQRQGRAAVAGLSAAAIVPKVPAARFTFYRKLCPVEAFVDTTVIKTALEATGALIIGVAVTVAEPDRQLAPVVSAGAARMAVGQRSTRPNRQRHEDQGGRHESRHGRAW